MESDIFHSYEKSCCKDRLKEKVKVKNLKKHNITILSISIQHRFAYNLEQSITSTDITSQKKEALTPKIIIGKTIVPTMKLIIECV